MKHSYFIQNPMLLCPFSACCPLYEDEPWQPRLVNGSVPYRYSLRSHVNQTQLPSPKHDHKRRSTYSVYDFSSQNWISVTNFLYSAGLSNTNGNDRAQNCVNNSHYVLHATNYNISILINCTLNACSVH